MIMAEVAVLMTVYNGMPYLPRSVESVLAQTLRDFRFVIVDDGSIDGTADYLAKITDPRVLVYHQANLGTGAAGNHGLKHCKVDFVARMDADDIALPGRLEAQRDFLIAHPEIGLMGTQVAPLGDRAAGGSLRLPVGHEAIYRAMRAGRHALAHSSIMFRMTLAQQIGGYWSLQLVDDWDFMLRMGEISRLANLDRVLHLYRVHEASLTGSGMRRMRLSIDFACELARRRAAGLPAITPEEFQVQRDSQGWCQRVRNAIDIYSRRQYRAAVAELYGAHRLRGAARLTWAAVCAPQLTLERLERMIGSQ
jgi:glycosyltransferase involved in cell wall biosynthesis